MFHCDVVVRRTHAISDLLQSGSYRWPWPIERVLQCVASLGVDSNVSMMTRSTSSSETLCGAPGRGSSSNPSVRRVTNRWRHLPTVEFVIPSCSATALLVMPSAQAIRLSAGVIVIKLSALIRKYGHVFNIY